MGQLLKKTDTYALDPKLFARIMTLPSEIRLDLLEFTGITAVQPEYLEQYVDALILEHGVRDK